MRSTSWFVLIGTLVLALLGVVAAQSTLADAAPPFPVTFAATLGGDQLVPPVETAASGGASAVLVGDLLVVTGDYTGLSGEVFGRGYLSMPGVTVHRAPAGESGGVVRAAEDQPYPGLRGLTLLSDGGTDGTFTGVFRLSEEQIGALEAGEFYLVVHTEAEPAGELRGQLLARVDVEITPQDLAGTWENPHLSGVSTYLRFEEDGTFVVGDQVDEMDRVILERGVYRIDGDHLTFTTETSGALECDGAVGTYAAMLSEDGQLRLFPLDDDCPYRLEDLRGALLVPMTP